MKQLILVLILAFLGSVCFAEESKYYNIEYENGELKLPKKDHWFMKLFRDQDRQVIFITTLIKRNAVLNKDIILVPPKVLENFKLTNNRVDRDKIGDFSISKSALVNPSEELLIKAEFFSIDKSKASSFVSSIKSLSSAYISSSTSQGVSEVANSALEALSSLVFSSDSVYVSYTIRVEEEKNGGKVNLFFDDTGNILSKPSSDGDVNANVSFKITSSNNVAVDFSRTFQNQSVGQTSLDIFDELTNAKNNQEKYAACKKLEGDLNRNFDKETSKNFLAIALNDIEWAQDETNSNCMDRDDALNYKVKHGLSNLVNCVEGLCVNTKSILLLLKVNANDQDISPFAGGSNVREMDCKFDKLKAFKTIKDQKLPGGLIVYTSNTCLVMSSNEHTYESTFTWLNDKLLGHGCTKISSGC
ncbi:hypothetical protein [Bacterioplanoides sp. SCSIO 12839]|uniref:hypothetical protein n=1 Tax=Bacterioplanoides sp. SCSIO 12839 TaxID=2829569 RepID=UPI002102690E|nr:hypothetical protein [Bacterioplanoides sp. SCSIO 12839]UTW48121.1 hypothetical protein KFF03_16450 [Bacterioplanoides sp. SCSIO 12839]